MPPTLFESRDRVEILTRLRTLAPDAARRWGRMTAPQMIAHLTDQMGHTLGDRPCAPVQSLLRGALVRYLSIYWVPWPKGRIKGPPDAFVTKPTTWEADVGALEVLVERFAARAPSREWPDHALFGKMTGNDWGVFCYKHFNHHLSQFGV